jgi:hypothetical protein
MIQTLAVALTPPGQGLAPTAGIVIGLEAGRKVAGARCHGKPMLALAPKLLPAWTAAKKKNPPNPLQPPPYQVSGHLLRGETWTIH